jgi:hypothetical protein
VTTPAVRVDGVAMQVANVLVEHEAITCRFAGGRRRRG